MTRLGTVNAGSIRKREEMLCLQVWYTFSSGSALATRTEYRSRKHIPSRNSLSYTFVVNDNCRRHPWLGPLPSQFKPGLRPVVGTRHQTVGTRHQTATRGIDIQCLQSCNRHKCLCATVRTATNAVTCIESYRELTGDSLSLSAFGVKL